MEDLTRLHQKQFGPELSYNQTQTKPLACQGLGPTEYILPSGNLNNDLSTAVIKDLYLLGKCGVFNGIYRSFGYLFLSSIGLFTFFFVYYCSSNAYGANCMLF